MSDPQHAHLDPLLADLLEGRRSPSEPAVQARFVSEPALRARYLELAALDAELGRVAARVRADLAAASQTHRDAAEDRIVEGFRARMRPRDKTKTGPWIWIAWLAAAALLAFGIWSFARREPSGDDDYLHGDRAMFVVTPNAPFGTLQWNRVERAVTFDLRAWTSRAAARERAAAVWNERGLATTSWTIPADQLPSEIRELVWELRQFDIAGTELARGSFAQRR